jgi:hypothetical protein
MVEALASCIHALQLGWVLSLSTHLLARWEAWHLLLVDIHSLAIHAEYTNCGAGGQFHWVSEFSPKRFQRGLSYIVGTCAT